MIVYEATKQEFMEHVERDEIAVLIYESYKNKIGRTTKSEINSWNNSMNYMYKVLNTAAIPNESGIAIEYKIPASSRRIDFMLSGLDKTDRNSAVIIELKQWDTVEALIDKDGVVKNLTLADILQLIHPIRLGPMRSLLRSIMNQSRRKEYISIPAPIYTIILLKRTIH